MNKNNVFQSKESTHLVHLVPVTRSIYSEHFCIPQKYVKNISQNVAKSVIL